MPATAPNTAARPQPSASIQPTRMPTSRLDTGFCAAARIARPSGVKRKKRKSSSSTTSVTPICAELVRAEDDAAEGSGSFGNGLGNGF